MYDQWMIKQENGKEKLDIALTNTVMTGVFSSLAA